jgi:hypothetical protein
VEFLARVRVVHVGAGNVRHHSVSERVARVDGTLRQERDTVHVRGQPLVQTVPVNGHRGAQKTVENFNFQGVTFAGLAGMLKSGFAQVF